MIIIYVLLDYSKLRRLNIHDTETVSKYILVHKT
jgi:hypothetical protein